MLIEAYYYYHIATDNYVDVFGVRTAWHDMKDVPTAPGMFENGIE